MVQRSVSDECRLQIAADRCSAKASYDISVFGTWCSALSVNFIISAVVLYCSGLYSVNWKITIFVWTFSVRVRAVVNYNDSTVFQHLPSSLVSRSWRFPPFYAGCEYYSTQYTGKEYVHVFTIFCRFLSTLLLWLACGNGAYFERKHFAVALFNNNNNNYHLIYYLLMINMYTVRVLYSTGARCRCANYSNESALYTRTSLRSIGFFLLTRLCACGVGLIGNA